ncbi:MAG: endolytic transglycosylase MltG [Oscillospiraceae bacterium]|nr:endolytic transglycosylase MltG [Oscillospiraceae bacterium]
MKSENEMDFTGTLPEEDSDLRPETEIRHKRKRTHQEEEPEYTPEKPRHSQSSHHKTKKKKTSQKERRQRSARVYGVLIMLTVVFVVSISLAVGIIEVGKDMLGINGSQRLVLFNIPEGATTKEIAQNLYEDGIIRIPKAFEYFSRLSKDNANFVAGNHEISASMAYETLIAELSKSMADDDSQAVVDVMFPEGITLYDAAMKLQENNVCEASKFLYYFNAGNLGYEFEDHLPPASSTLKFYRMEGYCFPDTYTFYEESEPADVCRKIYMNFNLKITDEYYDRMNELGISLDETITLASIIQKEAAHDGDMPMISSVFWNRLNSPEYSKLQSDVTTLYVENVIKPNIELDNQAIYDAYDTYVCNGLPAGALCNPGIAAIEAVLYPAESDYYYFYANVDTGETYFARTLEEHNANIEMVERIRQGLPPVEEENPEGEEGAEQ